MPRSEYAKPPKPMPPRERIRQIKFRFNEEDRLELLTMLPPRLHKFQIPGDPQPDRSGAEQLVSSCEEAIGSYRRAETLPRLNRANMMAAIRHLRRALAPFATGAMDMGSVDVLLGAFLGTPGMFDEEMAEITLQRVDEALANRFCELSETTIPPQATRNRQLLIHTLRVALQTCSADMSYLERVLFLACVLDKAKVPHDDPVAHADRLIPKAG
jgi:hypothetical protein